MAEQKKTGKKKFVIGCIIGIVAIILFAVVVLMLSFPIFHDVARSNWESRAKATLRAFAMAEMKYQASNEFDEFGSWEDLQKEGLLHPEYTRKNVVPKYVLLMEVSNTSIEEPPDTEGWRPVNTFTIVAFPVKTKPSGYLATFAIREDEIVREYQPQVDGVNAWGENGDYGTGTWLPVKKP